MPAKSTTQAAAGSGSVATHQSHWRAGWYGLLHARHPFRMPCRCPEWRVLFEELICQHLEDLSGSRSQLKGQGTSRFDGDDHRSCRLNSRCGRSQPNSIATVSRASATRRLRHWQRRLRIGWSRFPGLLAFQRRIDLQDLGQPLNDHLGVVHCLALRDCRWSWSPSGFQRLHLHSPISLVPDCLRGSHDCGRGSAGAAVARTLP